MKPSRHTDANRFNLLGAGVVTFVLVLTGAGEAVARERQQPSRSQRMAAYAVRTSAPIHATVCAAKPSARAVAENRCTVTFKNAAARRICDRLGPGRHDWFYVVGPAAERRTAVALCL